MTDITPTPSGTPPKDEGGHMSNWIAGFSALAAAVAAIFAFLTYQKNQELTVRLSSYEASFADGSLILTGGGSDFVMPEFIEVAPVWPLGAGIEVADLNGVAREFSGGRSNKDSGTIHFDEVVSRVCGLTENQDRCDIAKPKALQVTVHIHGSAQDTDIVELP